MGALTEAALGCPSGDKESPMHGDGQKGAERNTHYLVWGVRLDRASGLARLGKGLAGWRFVWSAPAMASCLCETPAKFENQDGVGGASGQVVSPPGVWCSVRSTESGQRRHESVCVL